MELRIVAASASNPGEELVKQTFRGRFIAWVVGWLAKYISKQISRESRNSCRAGLYSPGLNQRNWLIYSDFLWKSTCECDFGEEGLYG